MKRNKNASHYLPDVERLMYERSIRMNMETFYRIKGMAMKSGKPFATTAREILEKGYVRERLTPEHAVMVRQLTGMATNLNQIAHKANAAGYSAVSAQCTAMASRIRHIIEEVKS